MKRRKTLSALEERVGHRFSDPKLLESALTHVSGVKTGDKRVGSYQRLEFLGDHVLGLVISDLLFRSFPKADEGELSRRLADLVRKDACAEAALALDLGPFMRLGASEVQSGGRKKVAILADVCEAVIGAVFLDGGYDAAVQFVERYWRERMLEPHRPLRDPKTMLQEWAQGRGLPPPLYRELERRGPDHRPEFRVAVEVPGFSPGEGKGASKRDAEQAAAAAMLAREGVFKAEEKAAKQDV
jgi:ribonuclease-3